MLFLFCTFNFFQKKKYSFVWGDSLTLIQMSIFFLVPKQSQVLPFPVHFSTDTGDD